MNARALNKRVQIYNVIKISDGFSGSTTYDQLISNSWANIETAKTSASKLNEVGLDDMSLKLIITVRFRNDLPYNGVNQFIMYRGEKYSFTASPMDVNFSSSFVQLIATRNVISNSVVLSPIDADSDTIFENYKNRTEANKGTLSSEQCTKDYINELT